MNTPKIVIDGEQYREIRCEYCKAFIIYECDGLGKFAYNCPKCGRFNKIKLTVLKTNANMIKVKNYLLVKREGGENING